MDLATLIGLLLAWGAVVFSMFHATHGHLDAYFKPGEIFLVFGGAMGAALLSMPLQNVTGMFKSLKKWLFAKHEHLEHAIKEMVKYAETARRDGVLALETVARESPDPFLRRGLQLTIDGTDPEIIERIMRIEIEAMTERHKHGKHFFHTMAKFGPGFGLMATLIAQVAMFRNLDGDAGVIGQALAIALTGTLYGCILQNLVAGPVAEKLAHPLAGRNLRQGNHPPGRPQHPGRQQPPRGRNAAFELPERKTTSLAAQGSLGLVHRGDAEDAEKRRRECRGNGEQKEIRGTISRRADMDVNELTEAIIGAAIEVHRHLGPGLLESAYQKCLARELTLRGIPFESERTLPVVYKGITLDCGYRIDLLVAGLVVVEAKAVAATDKIHEAQLLTYLRLGGWKVGLLINFNVPVLKDGIKRRVLGL